MARKVIITVAPSSNFQGKEANPAIPYSPAEIAQEAYDAYNAGASIVHFHARDNEGIPTNDPMVVCDIISALKNKVPNMIMQPSIAPANRPDKLTTVDDGLNILDTVVAQGLKTEMCSFDSGICVTKSPCPDLEGPLKVFWWHHDWLLAAAKKVTELGFKPEFEIAQPAEIDNVMDIVKAGILKDPSFTLLMGMKANQIAVKWSPEILMSESRLLPAGCNWGALGVGPAQHQATVMSIILGGQARVGFEDNIYYRKGELAKSNAQLVERIANVIHDLGMEVATPDEARAVLKL